MVITKRGKKDVLANYLPWIGRQVKIERMSEMEMARYIPHDAESPPALPLARLETFKYVEEGHRRRGTFDGGIW
jgi:hypothetical protein